MTGCKAKRRSPKYESITFGLLSVILTFFALLILKNPKLVFSQVAKTLALCVNLLIPSLFPAMVLFSLASSSGVAAKITGPFQAPLSKILGISKGATIPYFLGILGGYASSAQSVSLLYKSGEIDEAECNKILAASSVPSISFVLNFIGISIFENAKMGIFMLTCIILSTILVGFFDNLFSKKKTAVKHKNTVFFERMEKKSIASCLSEAISSSAFSMLIICACVLFFSVVIEASHFALDALKIPAKVQEILLGSLEITHGISSLREVPLSASKVALCGFFSAFSGLSATLQVLSICKGLPLSSTKFFTLKFLQGIVCSLLALLGFNLFFK